MQDKLRTPPLRILAAPLLSFLPPVTAAQQLPSHCHPGDTTTPVTLKHNRKISNYRPTTSTLHRHLTPKNCPSQMLGAPGWALRGGREGGELGRGRKDTPAGPHRAARRRDASLRRDAAAPCRCAPQGHRRELTARPYTYTYMYMYYRYTR